MANVGTIDAKVGLNLRPLEIDSNKAKSKFQALANTMKRTFQVGAVAGGVALAALSVKAVRLGIDAEEVEGKFNTAFRGIENQAKQTAKVLASSYNISQTESKKLLSNTGDLLKGFGFTAQGALDLSNKTQQLAADLASYSNIEGGATRASEILTKALLGERDSLVSLGIKVSDADVKQRLLEKGQQDLTGTTLLAAKAQATYELALQQSGDALGDTARTSNSTANQIRELKANIEDITKKLGQAFLPATNAAVRALNNFFNAIGTNEIRALESQIDSLTKKMEEVEEDVRKAMFEDGGITGEQFRDRMAEVDKYQEKIDKLAKKVKGLKEVETAEDVKILPTIDETESTKAANKMVSDFESIISEIGFDELARNMSESMIDGAEVAAKGIEDVFRKRNQNITPLNRLILMDLEEITSQQSERAREMSKAFELATSTGRSEMTYTTDFSTQGKSREDEMRKARGLATSMGRDLIEPAQKKISGSITAISQSLFSLGDNLENKFLTQLGNVASGAEAIYSSMALISKGTPLGIITGIFGAVAGVFNMFESEKSSLTGLNNELDSITDNTDKATNSLKDMSTMLFNISDAVNVDILRARTYAKFSQQGSVNGSIKVVVAGTNGQTISTSYQPINPATGTR